MRMFLSLVVLLNFSTAIFASSGSNSELMLQDELDNTMSIVVEYLNNQIGDINLLKENTHTYNIPIKDGHSVDVELSIKEVPVLPIYRSCGQDDYTIETNKTYTYTLNLKKLDAVLGGSVTLSVEYKTYTNDSGIICIKYKTSSIRVTPPQGYAVKSKDSFSTDSAALIFKTSSYVTFETPVFSVFVSSYIDAEFISFGSGDLRVKYEHRYL